ncbi:MAG: glycine cleavage system aminomethyltransferase GcvT [Chloroflexi bacterium]|nr:glycine cleavage system aminomethyltransferase GcvT [Chloroflexota bacterium]
MKKTALYDKHIALGAKMISFAGWYMPVHYSSIFDEHNTVRTAVGLFDIDHMGQIEISGPDAHDFLQYVMTFDISRIAVGEAHYSLLCYDDGTVVDDTFVYHLPDRYLVVVNAANNDKDTRWLLYHARGYDVRIRNSSDALYMLALQGPRAEEVLQQLTDTNLQQLEYHYCTEDRVASTSAVIARTGYTGEDGFELFFSVDKAISIWNALMETGASYGIRPIGLGARDTLRFEARLPLYGHELGPDINPYEARLGWVVNLHKVAFVGKEALLKIRLEGIKRRLIGFEINEGGMARHGFKIHINGNQAGFVTSGAYSPILRKRLGLGYVPREHAVLGTELEIPIRSKMAKATIVETPFYEPKKGR